MATLGKNIIVKWNTGTNGSMVAVAAAKSCAISGDAEAKEISSPDSTQARSYIAGRTGWKVTINYLVSNVLDMLKRGNTYTLNILNSGGNTGLTGSAILITCDIQATTGNLAQGTFVFLGTGELSNLTSS